MRMKFHLNPLNILSTFLALVLVYLVWLGGVQYMLSLGPITYGPAAVVFVFGVFSYVYSFWKPSWANVAADVSLALGIFGTVIGLIVALPFIKSNPDLALAGISLGLFKTAFGILNYVVLTIQGWMLDEHSKISS